MCVFVKVWDLDKVYVADTVDVVVYECPVDIMVSSTQRRLVFVKTSAKGLQYVDSFGIDIWNASSGRNISFLTFGRYGKLLQMEVSSGSARVVIVRNQVFQNNSCKPHPIQTVFSNEMLTQVGVPLDIFVSLFRPVWAKFGERTDFWSTLFSYTYSASKTEVLSTNTICELVWSSILSLKHCNVSFTPKQTFSEVF